MVEMTYNINSLKKLSSFPKSKIFSKLICEILRWGIVAGTSSANEKKIKEEEKENSELLLPAKVYNLLYTQIFAFECAIYIFEDLLWKSLNF